MSALDVHVLSSRVDAFPNVVAEAMCCGTPCVVTDVGDAALIVGRTGWVAPPGDPAALAAAMGEALAERADADAWSRRRQAARERIVANFGLSTVVESYARLWSEVVG
jgi:glycosyltransferase involved in cell wall biosynthesis